ncbi:Gfo/Idh/MocA family protein [Virgibacillus byunsanensis]|uniref:Gfo/Idh/MocA family protein n=1 Tax=Virgibacillus byunsanensis TaxID=570945 RepID=A0ABW3LFR4_9BACI
MIKAALLGAGNRGMFAYGSYALDRPNEIQFVAIAEPNTKKREKFAETHGIEEDMQFSNWEDLLDNPKLCDVLLVCTQDRNHYEPTMKALDIGYDILLEKPMSPNPSETLEMAEKAHQCNQILTVCHVLRYSTFFSELKSIIDDNKIGDIMSIQWNENVGYYHQAHSFVRGNWRNSTESSSMILQKCSHDMDMLQWLIGEQCTKVSSFGSLSYFNEDNAPEGSTERCTDGCAVEHECPYSALKWYHNEKTTWPVNVVELTPDLDMRLKAIKEGPYGRCVYRSDNNVVDHQVANLLFENGVTVAFTMSAFTKEQGRTFQLMGTKGEIIGSTTKNEITIKYFSGKEEVISPAQVQGGHGGADTMIMRDFVKQINDKTYKSKTSAMESAKSHLIAFAAEESRLSGETISMDEYMNQLKQLN